ncbi:hypothetical protein BDZ89DRAFT_1147538 [Hymenopellis radicata]|nr:hypothetical protein BDZ89DRAFT_1147538 [Hymenopellis radicata]
MSMRTSDPPPHSEDDVIWLLTDSEDERPSSLRTSNKPHQPSLPPAITTKQDAAKDDLAEDTLAAAFAGLAVSSPSRLYAVNQGGTTRITSHWSDAGYSQQQSNAHVSRVSPKKRPTKKRAGAYVVFVGTIPGVYATWDACEAQILHQTGSIYQGYRTRTMADAAYDYASKHGLVHPTSGPRTIYSSRRVQAPVPDVWSARHRLAPACAVMPGMPSSPGLDQDSTTIIAFISIEAAFHHVGIPGSTHRSYTSYEEALKEYSQILYVY